MIFDNGHDKDEDHDKEDDKNQRHQSGLKTGVMGPGLKWGWLWDLKVQQTERHVTQD